MKSSNKKEVEWKAKDKRFVAFFDILGFKDMVLRIGHTGILKKLESLRGKIDELEEINKAVSTEKEIDIPLDADQTRAITFSDSIVFFSKTGSFNDLMKIVFDAHSLIDDALGNDIALKGAISFGEITVDFKKSLFFGQPLIDAYLLHEELWMLDVILDHHAENQVKNLVKGQDLMGRILHREKVKMKFGSSTHTIVRSFRKPDIENRIESLEKLYSITSGKPRIYIDNSIDHYKNLKPSK